MLEGLGCHQLNQKKFQNCYICITWTDRPEHVHQQNANIATLASIEQTNQYKINFKIAKSASTGQTDRTDQPEHDQQEYVRIGMLASIEQTNKYKTTDKIDI